MTTARRDRCTEILDLIDRCLADVAAGLRTDRRPSQPDHRSHHTA